MNYIEKLKWFSEPNYHWIHTLNFWRKYNDLILQIIFIFICNPRHWNIRGSDWNLIKIIRISLTKIGIIYSMKTKN